MRKSTSRTLYLLGVAVAIVATVLLIPSLAGSTTSTDAYGAVHVTSIGNPPLFAVSIALYCAAGILGFIAWIGALIRMAQFQEWTWFVLLIVLSGITMLVYIFAGPDQPRQRVPAWAPPGYPGPPPGAPYGRQ